MEITAITLPQNTSDLDNWPFHLEDIDDGLTISYEFDHFLLDYPAEDFDIQNGKTRVS